MYNTLRKLKREASAYLNNKDRELLKDFLKDTRHYMMHPDLFEITKSFYDKREAEKI